MIEAKILKEKLNRTFSLYTDLVHDLEEESLQMDLAGLPSNKIGEQLWCVIGARQSYLIAIINCGWQGFACGLDWKNTVKKAAVLHQLKSSSDAFLLAIENMQSLNSTQQSSMIDLIEHEAQHHGQLVRYLYAQKLPVPQTWKKRYNLD